MERRFFLVLAAALPATLLAQTGTHESHDAAKGPDEVMTDGEIRKVDKAQGKVTIRHESIENLDMPPMTMVFQMRDPTLLNQVKAGDKVRFHVEKEGATYVVTRLERAQ